MEIKNSTFIVTGGSSGLGAATVEMVVAGGGNAIIADVNKVQGEALAARLGKQARYVECDVTQIGGVALAIDAKDAKAVRWYARFGAVRLLDDPLKLILPLVTIEKALKTAGKKRR